MEDDVVDRDENVLVVERESENRRKFYNFSKLFVS